MLEISIQGDTSDCGEPPVDFKTKVPFWPGKARTVQVRPKWNFFKSTGGSSQPDMSPCRATHNPIAYSDTFLNSQLTFPIMNKYWIE